MRSLRSLLLLSSLSLTSACMLGPDYQPPVTDVPAEWHQGGGNNIAHDLEATDVTADLQWWDMFKDEHLQALIRLALENNRDLKDALLNIEKARASHRIERSGLFPTADLRLENERERSSLLEDGNNSIANDQMLAIDLSWELDLWGATRRANEAAFADYLGSAYGWRSVRLALISDVAATYFSLLGAEAELKINQDTLVARERAYVIAVKRFKGGLTSKLEVQQARVELASARAAIPRAEQDRLEIENSLSILLGVNPRDHIVKATLEQQYLPATIKPGLPSNLLQRRPDIMRTEQALKVASEQVGIAKAAYFPTFKLTGNFGFETVEFDDLLDSDGEKWIVSSNLLTPIFNAGKLDAQYSIAEINLKQAKLSYEQVVLQAMREVSDSLNSYYKTQEILNANKELADASREYLQLAIKRYRHGVLAYLDVLDAQRKLLDAQLKESASREGQLKSLVLLYKALGGGWDLAISNNVAIKTENKELANHE